MYFFCIFAKKCVTLYAFLNNMKKKQKKILIKWGILLGLVLLVVGAIAGDRYYRQRICNFVADDGEEHGYYIYPDTPLDSVMAWVEADYKMGSRLNWYIDARRSEFTSVRPGYYRFGTRISNRTLIRRLSNGYETPVRLSWTNTTRTRQQLAGRLGKQLLTDSVSIMACLDSLEFLQRYEVNRETAICLFIPDTYEVYWTMTPEGLFDRMQSEYRRFWNKERRDKAEALGLTPEEVATLASIVESETNRQSEWPTIASLYLNRLRIHMPMQACPTAIYASGDFTIRRVLNHHLQNPSPYNTYRHAGLPPGPIRCTRAVAMDSVLVAPKTPYLFMCANPDFSGTHVFSANYAQHAATARRYQQELNRRHIRR